MKRLLNFPLMLGLVIAGCDTNQQSSVTISPASSSNEALTRALDAMSRRDTDAMLSLVSGGSKAQEFFMSLIDSFEAFDAFRQRFIEAYGQEAWGLFQAPLPDGQKRPDMNLIIPDFDQIQKNASGWEANGENQGVFEALPRMSLPFKQIEGGWVIDGTSVFPDEETLVGWTETQRKMTDFIESYMKAIGHEGINPEDIDYQMGKDFMILLLGGELKIGDQPSNPDRFNINEL